MPRRSKALHDRRRQALVSLMAEKEVNSVTLAAKIEPTDVAKRKKIDYRIRNLVRAKGFGKLESADATLIANALEVPVARLLAGELSEAEAATAQRGGGTRTESRKALMKDREALGRERRKALKAAMGRSMGPVDLQKMLVAAGKNWSLSQVASYTNGVSFVNKDFLLDVAPLLNVDAQTLVIREHALEDFGRRRKQSGNSPSSAAQQPVAQEVAGVALSVTCKALSVEAVDQILFNRKAAQFVGQVSRVVEKDGQYRLELSLPIGEGGVAALLKLVMSDGGT